MQIHELNNFTGSLDESAKMVVDNGTDTGKISVPQLLQDVNSEINQAEDFLNERIDNIIAGGAAPSEAEIVDARLGADGETYPSLGDAIRGQVGNLGDELEKTNITVFSEGDTKYPLVFTDGKWLRRSDGGIGNATGRATTMDYYPVFAGQVLKVNLYENWADECSIALYNTNKEFTGYKTTAGKAEITITQDGYARFSTITSLVSISDAYVINKYQPFEDGYFEAKAQQINTLQNATNENIEYSYPLVWTDGKYLREVDGNAANASGYAISNYLQVFNGQEILVHAYANYTNEATVCIYDVDKAFVESYKSSNQEVRKSISSDGYVRICTNTSIVPKSDAYMKNIANNKNGTPVNYFIANQNEETASEQPIVFYPSTPKITHKYKGEVTPAKRYLAIGFDDFRDSDFSAIIPLFAKYEGRATFNAIASGTQPTASQQNKVSTVIYEDQEIGDHTFLHYAFPFVEAPFNGQDPASPDGPQTPYPTNSMMRDDAGSGSNAFGQSLTANVSLDGCSVTSKWGSLTDEECQTIRDTYSVLKNPTYAPLLDGLSERYLGTSGRSAGSFDSDTGKYTGGIFTGCATSDNHEVWERILTIVQMYYKDWFGLNYNFECWSLPGTNYFGLGLVSGSSKYYDPAHTKLYNMNARFESSLYTDGNGNALERSFGEALAAFGYKYTHDFAYYGRWDGKDSNMMSKQFYINADLSKPNGIMNPTNRSVLYNNISSQYPESFFVLGTPKGQQMYEANNSFKTFIDALRNNTANGMIHGEVIDSVDNYSEKMFFEEVLKFCEKMGIEVISKAEAFDVCFNHPVRNGNLLYNPGLINSVETVFPNASNLPTNPDGFTGDCSVSTDGNGVRELVTTGETVYTHYGIPVGVNLRFSCKAKGSGSITIKYLPNRGSYRGDYLVNIVTGWSISSGSYQSEYRDFLIPDKPLVAWSQSCAGYDDKAMGIKIIISSGLTIKDMRLEII